MIDPEFVRMLNAVEVSDEEFLDFVEAAEGLEEEKEALISVTELDRVVLRFKAQPVKLAALYYRWNATVQFLRSEASKGWAFPRNEDGSIPALPCVIAAAAAHPLVDITERISFEPDSFSKRLLESSDPEAHA
jgi:hypothetical protein